MYRKHTLCLNWKIYKFETTINYDTLLLSRKEGQIVSLSVEKEVLLSRKVLLFLVLQFLTCIT
jgi:hypothetical protein